MVSIRDDKQFDEFIEEIEKDIRQERFSRIWTKYGKAITVGLAVIFGLTTLYVMWKHNKIQQEHAMALQFLSAQKMLEGNQQSQEKGLALLETLSDKASSYACLSGFQKAKFFIKKRSQEDYRKAISIFDTLIKDVKTPSNWRDLALFYKGMVLFELRYFDAPRHCEEFAEILEPLTHEGKPWRLLALELRGRLLHKLKKYESASEHFVKIAQDPKAPEGSRMRAQLLSQMAAKDFLMSQKKEEDISIEAKVSQVDKVKPFIAP